MFNNFVNKKFRDAFLEENIRTRLAFQVRALREKNNWSQPQLAEHAHKPQSVISRIENPQYGRFTLRTLLDLASTFDVALFVSFVPYSKLIREIDDVSPKSLAVASYKEEKTAMDGALNKSVSIEVPTGQIGIEAYPPSLKIGAALLSQYLRPEEKGMALAAAQPSTPSFQHEAYYEMIAAKKDVGATAFNKAREPQYGQRALEDKI